MRRNAGREAKLRMESGEREQRALKLRVRVTLARVVGTSNEVEREVCGGRGKEVMSSSADTPPPSMAAFGIAKPALLSKRGRGRVSHECRFSLQREREEGIVGVGVSGRTRLERCASRFVWWCTRALR